MSRQDYDDGFKGYGWRPANSDWSQGRYDASKLRENLNQIPPSDLFLPFGIMLVEGAIGSFVMTFSNETIVGAAAAGISAIKVLDRKYSFSKAAKITIPVVSALVASGVTFLARPVLPEGTIANTIYDYPFGFAGAALGVCVLYRKPIGSLFKRLNDELTKTYEDEKNKSSPPANTEALRTTDTKPVDASTSRDGPGG